jgi:parallel beta-helix repeat protein
MKDSGIFIWGDILEYWYSLTFDTSNTINGKPVYYWKDRVGGTIPQGAGQVILADCQEVEIAGQELTHCGGIQVAFSNNCTIINNNITSNSFTGIELTFSNNCTIINNNVSSNSIYGINLYYSSGNNISGNIATFNIDGIHLGYSYYNSIYNNTLMNNSNGIWMAVSEENIIINNTAIYNSAGISLSYAGPNHITGNNLSLNEWDGLRLHESNNSIIINNTFFDNTRYGLRMKESNRNNITGNTFFSNSHDIYLEDSSNNNIYHNNIFSVPSRNYDNQDNNWDNGYPSGGNYWSDYTGEDRYKGSDQDILGFDGIGDSPYEIDLYTYDNYPLMEPIPDTRPPRIERMHPFNNSIIQLGSIVYFSIYDGNLDFASYSIDGGTEVFFFEPFVIYPEGLGDTEHTVLVKAQDKAGNLNYRELCFTIDSIPPTIWFDPSLNHSTILPGSTIELNITDLHIYSVEYSLDGVNYTTLETDYLINTSSWIDGHYIISVKAMDSAYNRATVWFEVTINSTLDMVPPKVLSTIPVNDSGDIDINTTITISFSEPMNRTGVEENISLIPSNEYNIEWNEIGTNLSISFETNNLAYNITYMLTIYSQITDVQGNPMDSNFTLIFTTKSPPLLDTDNDGIPDISDPDDDNDGVPDEKDDYPLDPDRWKKPEEEDFTVYIVLVVMAVVAAVLVILVLRPRGGRKVSVEDDFFKEEIEDNPQGNEAEEPPPETPKPLPPPPPPPI